MTERESRTPPESAVAEVVELRSLLYEVMREVPTSNSGIFEHAYLQDLHRRVIAALGEERASMIRSDYWIGRFHTPDSGGVLDSLSVTAVPLVDGKGQVRESSGTRTLC